MKNILLYYAYRRRRRQGFITVFLQLSFLVYRTSLSLSLSLKKFFSFIQKILENFKDVKNNQLISPILTTLLYHSFNHDTELMVFKKLFA